MKDERYLYRKDESVDYMHLILDGKIRLLREQTGQQKEQGILEECSGDKLAH
ncbi:MAG: hypothetical protein ACNS62_16415 [Candidatus Cyclobacteriaceae bacterium M3_2C_046]